MAHRVRSRTAESAENKKTKVTPRRLTEKIAIMRRREHEQSEAFQKAMKSIFEMQQAQQARANTSIHSGGGSMPSLVAIDSNPVPPSIDMQSVFNDLNEVTMRSSLSSTTSRERPHSGGPTGRRSQFDKRTQSISSHIMYPSLCPLVFSPLSPSLVLLSSLCVSFFRLFLLCPPLSLPLPMPPLLTTYLFSQSLLFLFLTWHASSLLSIVYECHIARKVYRLEVLLSTKIFSENFVVWDIFIAGL
ncbi:hypothetical protein GBAR_LOCUS31800 [Geodia barretti]|uniref:Transducer of regulated CREB activity N-terminal domain-containing protein n=1 Tax=Geodia barretti TaxID=519541 RepID=A0AA35U2T7_GEOBA|nr:hypothetical protein GBAR_LOCUS31800 [Geodia barretti]